MITYVVILLLIPAVLSLVKVPKAGLDNDPHRGPIGAILRWTAEVTINKRKEVIIVSALIVGVFVGGAFRIRTDNFLLEELFKVNPVSQALHRTEDVLTGVIPVEISIEADEDGGVFEPSVLRAIERLQEHMEADPYTGHTISIVDLVKELAFVMEGERKIPETRRRIAQYITFFEMSEDASFLEMVVDGPRRRARISGSQKDWGTEQFFAWYDGTGSCDERAACGRPIQELIDEHFASVPATARVTGGNLVAARALSRLVADMILSLGTAFIVITLLMMGLLRSFRIGLLSMLPNVLPLAITLGFMGWVGIPLRTSTVLIFSVSLGVAANDTIHFLVRYRRELFRTGDREQAIRDTMMSTGRAIIFTSVLLVFGFGTMMTTRFVGIVQMGILGSVTLFAALLGDLFILPVALGLTKPWSRLIEDKQRAD
jgi:predicted RND superfamily exporter protein